MEKKEKGWKTDIQDWTKLSKETADLYLRMAEDKFKSTVNILNEIDASNNRMFALITSLLTISTGYLFSGDFLYLQIVSVFAVFCCIGIVFILWKNMKPYGAYTEGIDPDVLFVSEFADNELEERLQYLGLVFKVMELTQDKITHNRNLINIRHYRISLCKKILLFLPVTFVVAALFMYFIGYRLVWVLPQ